jgi:hypothetical protein
MQQATTYPVQFAVDYPARPLDRVSTAFRIFAAIPILVVLGTIGGGNYEWSDQNGATTTAVAAGGLLFLAPLVMIVFRQKYPGGGSTGTWNFSASATE